MRNRGDLLQVATEAGISPRHATRKLAWPLAATVIGLLALGGWVAIFYMARRVFGG